MRWFEKVADRLHWLAIPNLTVILVGGSATFFLIGSFHPEILQSLPLSVSKVWQGEVWRLFTFLFYPVDMHPVFAFFSYYLFFIMSSALEAEWGDQRFTLYVAIACLSAIIVAFIFPWSTPTNGFILGSIFLAFAYLYPNFELYIFFVFPVKMKYLATFVWISYIYFAVKLNWNMRLFLLVSVVNFFLFFGGSIWENARAGRRRMETKAGDIRAEHEPFHRCVVCKITEKKDPKAQFRVCSKCNGLEYCSVHLQAHEHRS